MLFAVLSTTPLAQDPFAGYPDWLVILIGTLVAVVMIWILIKVIKLALWLLLGTVLIVGLGTAAWLLIK